MKDQPVYPENISEFVLLSTNDAKVALSLNKRTFPPTYIQRDK